jgi:hypothetical protein
VAHSAYGVVGQPQRTAFSFCGQLDEVLGKAPLQQFWVSLGEERVVRNEAPRFMECCRERFDGFRIEPVVHGHRLGASVRKFRDQHVDMLIDGSPQHEPDAHDPIPGGVFA